VTLKVFLRAGGMSKRETRVCKVSVCGLPPLHGGEKETSPDPNAVDNALPAMFVDLCRTRPWPPDPSVSGGSGFIFGE
jgi:hypothetical protein